MTLHVLLCILCILRGEWGVGYSSFWLWFDISHKKNDKYPCPHLVCHVVCKYWRSTNDKMYSHTGLLFRYLHHVCACYRANEEVLTSLSTMRLNTNTNHESHLLKHDVPWYKGIFLSWPHNTVGWIVELFINFDIKTSLGNQ